MAAANTVQDKTSAMEVDSGNGSAAELAASGDEMHSDAPNPNAADDGSSGAEGDSDQGDGDDEDGEEDVYVVERIVRHRKKGKKTQYYLKWQGYPDSENTWEDEDNVFSEDLIKAYWDSQGGKPKSTPTRSTSAKSTPAKPVAPIPAPPTRQTRTSPPPIKGTKRKALSEGTKDVPRRSKSKAKFPDPDSESWEDDVDFVITAEKVNGGLYIHIRWKNGTTTCHPSELANAKCPQKVIQFYEKNLRFKRPES